MRWLVAAKRFQVAPLLFSNPCLDHLLVWMIDRLEGIPKRKRWYDISNAKPAFRIRWQADLTALKGSQDASAGMIYRARSQH